MAENLITALLNTVLGMGTVFVILIFISFLISLFKYIPILEEKLKRSKKQDQKPEPAPAVRVPVPAPEPVKKLTNDSELVAVITAAVVAASGVESADKLIVRSIKRVNKRR